MPRRLHFGAHQVDVLETLDQWYGTDYRYIKVRGNDGGLYILRFDEPRAEWELTMFKVREHKCAWRKTMTWLVKPGLVNEPFPIRGC